jgi:hypothetical protein
MEIKENSPGPKKSQLLPENRKVRIVIAEVISCDEAFAQQLLRHDAGHGPHERRRLELFGAVRVDVD